ncbi:MAG: 50S ribosomal protein L18 [Alphaproteobacteria bacterium]|nr:50S ribosomal protein L18 [Alphaproteobacteria bacterium]
MNTPRKLFKKRQARVRTALRNAANGKMRLSVFRSGKHIYAQIIDDIKGATVASASTLDKEVRTTVEKTSTVAAAGVIGKTVAERALKAGVSEVVFDRGGYIYHGRVKALADAAREAGLKF